MKEYDYIIWKEGNHYVSQCINVNVSSFGHTAAEAKLNLRESVELYFENENEPLPGIEQVTIGKDILYV